MNKLINLLEHQEKNLNSLLDIITGYQKALIAGDINALDHLLDLEQKTISSIQSNVEIQHTLFIEISRDYNLNLSQSSIGNLIDALPSGSKEVIKLNYFKNSLKVLADQITEKNRLNSVLINHSRNFIKEIFNRLSPLIFSILKLSSRTSRFSPPTSDKKPKTWNSKKLKTILTKKN